MASNSIKLFQFSQKYCETFGIQLPVKSNEKRCIFKAIRWILDIFLLIFWVTSLAFMVYDAKSMVEYGMTLFTMITITLALVIYLITIWQIEEILKFVETCESFINKRKSKKKKYSIMLHAFVLSRLFHCNRGR